jgi:hypothetical protein
MIDSGRQPDTRHSQGPSVINWLGAFPPLARRQRPLLAGGPLLATRPLYFFRPDGPMLDTFELRLTITPALGP